MSGKTVMPMFKLRIGLCWLLLEALSLAAPVRAEEGPVDYLRDIKPFLHERCYACHGALQQNAELRLDTAAAIVRGGESGPAIVPGKSGQSLVIEAVTGDVAVWRMPPEGEPLTTKQIALLRHWIDQGARLPEHEEAEPDPREHWAFQPPARSEAPQVKSTAWIRNPIDAFLAAEHERLGLAPAPPAADHVLLRRIYLDLVGLPPTPKDAQQLDSYESVVDRLLNSPEHGQRWGRHWMDVWRYSDWSGEGQNLVRGSPKHIWRWRDWIVESLNQDKGYDRMLLEMLAGDEIAPGDPSILPATGFLARNWYEYNRNVWLDDTVEHTAKAFQGLTLSCARCHDHKFDPLSQREYYAWRAIFEPHDMRIDPVPGQPDTALDGLPRVYDAQADAPTYLFIRGEERRPDKKNPLAAAIPAALGGQLDIEPIPLPLAIWYPALAAGDELVRHAESELAAAEADLSKIRADDKATRQRAEGRLALAQAELDSLRARLAAERVRFALTDAPTDNSLQSKDLSIKAIEADRLAVERKVQWLSLHALTKSGSDRRSADRELTATKELLKKADAGYRPLGPQFPQSTTGRRLALAKWLTDRQNPLTARVAVNHVWLRHFGEPLVASVDDFGRRAPRPRHAALLDWLAVELIEHSWSLKHLHRLMVTSSAYRMASATHETPAANLKIDPENRWLWRMNSRRAEAEVIRDSILHVAGSLDCSPGGPEIALDKAEKSTRRSLYFRHAFERVTPFLKAFDGADAMECYRRPVTVLPQQALALANSPLPYEQASRLAGQLSPADKKLSDAEFVRLAFEHVLTRPPTATEQEECLAFLDEAAGQEGRASLVHVLFNHNDFITIR
jgi:hypothetical protein